MNRRNVFAVAAAVVMFALIGGMIMTLKPAAAPTPVSPIKDLWNTYDGKPPLVLIIGADIRPGRYDVASGPAGCDLGVSTYDSRGSKLDKVSDLPLLPRARDYITLKDTAYLNNTTRLLLSGDCTVWVS